MLPFLKPKKAGSVVTASYSGGEMKPGAEEGEHSEEEMFAAQDMMSAIHSKDSKAFLSALKAYHEINKSKEDALASTPG